MNKLLAISALCLVAALAVAVWFLVQQPTEIEVGDTPYVFLPSEDTDNWNLISCDFRNPHDRFSAAELWREPLEPCSLGQGWTYPSPAGVLGMARHPRFEIRLPTGGAATLLMTLKAYPNPERRQAQTVTVRINDADFGPAEVADDWTTVQFSLPPGVLRPGVNRISTSFEDRASPADSGKRDTRKFSAWVREVVVVRGDREPLSDAEIRRTINRALTDSERAGAKVDPDHDGFVITRSGTLVLPLSLAGTAERVEFRVRATTSRGDAPEVRLRVRSLTSDAAVGPVPLIATGDATDRAMLAADVRGLAGETGIAMIDVDLTAKRQVVRVSGPVVTAGPEPARPDGRAAGDGGPAAPAPDIVMITLDAARPDHFSCYGYDRPTTPNIDRLAADSAVFTRVFALAPYTLCSVPTMVTGLSPLDHQVTNHGHRLTDEATTLAEYLGAVGYRTACISASPNNSRTIGTDQGYDDFIETWRIEPRPGSRDPFLLSRMAVDWLAENGAEAPIHLQLHYVPPHAPYDPRPEHDLFTDPEYSGQFDGYHTSLGALDHQLWHHRPEDLEHVVGLYDGNLREVDAAVEQVLEALRARPRWRDTVVLVTSDHGEAFLEHGRMGHNSTLYDEMLHVPFILRLPEDAARAVDTSRLGSLADIVPTFLGLAGVTPEEDIAGLDLLADEDASRGRRMVARTTGNPPLYSLRTSQWKLMLAGSGQGALYNVARDPDEREDLALRVQPPFAGLGMLLTERLARPPRFEALPELEELPEEDTEMLEALGYLQ